MEYDLDEAEGESIFDNGRYAVDVLTFPDGSYVEFQVFRWFEPREWEDAGRWKIVSAGEPSDWTPDVPAQAIDAANAWLNL